MIEPSWMELGIDFGGISGYTEVIDGMDYA